MYNFIDHKQLKNSLQWKPLLINDSLIVESPKRSPKISKIQTKSRQKLGSSLISEDSNQITSNHFKTNQITTRQIIASQPADLINSLTDLKVAQLKIIAQQYGISTTAPKDYLCKRIRSYLLSHPNPRKVKVSPLLHRNRKYHQTLQSLIKTQIDQFDLLLDLSTEKLKWIIGIIKLHQGKVNLKTVLTNIPSNSEKVKILIGELINKLCLNQKPIKELQSKINLNRREKIHLCINRILESQGIHMNKFISENKKPVMSPVEPRKIIIELPPTTTKLDSDVNSISSQKEASWATRVNSVMRESKTNQRNEQPIKPDLENKVIIKPIQINPLFATKVKVFPVTNNPIKVWRENFVRGETLV